MESRLPALGTVESQKTVAACVARAANWTFMNENLKYFQKVYTFN